jgi:hypothetical protein
VSRTLSASGQADEQTIIVLRRHWWLLIRALFPPLLVAAVLPGYAAAEVLAPNADLSRFEGLFLTCDLALCGVLLLKWLIADLTPWWAESYVITSQRAFCRRGVWVREQRETTLAAISDISCAIPSARERFFQFGDLTIQMVGRRTPLVFHAIARPRKVQALLAGHARAASRDQSGSPAGNAAIGEALGRIFQGTVGAAGSPTLAVGRITAEAARAQRNLSLQPGEVVLYAARRHGVTLVGSLIAIFALMGGLGIAVWRLSLPIPLSYLLLIYAGPTMWAVWLIHEWRALLHVLTTHRMIEIRCSWLDRPIPRAVSLSTIEEVLVRRITLVGSLCRFGTLLILDSGGECPLRLQAAADPEALLQRLTESIEAARRLSRIREQEHLASTLTDWFEEYHRLQVQS